MNKGSVVTWFQEAAAMTQTVSNVEEQIAKIKGMLELAETTGDGNQLMQLTNQLHHLQTALDKMTPALLQRTKTASSEGAREYMSDLQHKIGQAEQLYDAWRGAQARFELAVKLGEFDDKVEKRAEAEAQLEVLKQRYETAVELASEAIPSSVRLLHV